MAAQNSEIFLTKLNQFYQSKGITFEYVPKVGHQKIDLCRLYTVVQSLGGVAKVNDFNKWDIVYEEYGFPKALVNGCYIIKQIYRRYLENYEKVNRGENIEVQELDIQLRLNPCKSLFPLAYIYPNNFYTYDSRNYKAYHSINKRPWQKIYLSLLSGLSNEINFAINMIYNIASRECLLDEIKHFPSSKKYLNSLDIYEREEFRSVQKFLISLSQNTNRTNDGFNNVFYNQRGKQATLLSKAKEILNILIAHIGLIPAKGAHYNGQKTENKDSHKISNPLKCILVEKGENIDEGNIFSIIESNSNSIPNVPCSTKEGPNNEYEKKLYEFWESSLDHEGKRYFYAHNLSKLIHSAKDDDSSLNLDNYFILTPSSLSVQKSYNNEIKRLQQISEIFRNWSFIETNAQIMVKNNLFFKFIFLSIHCKLSNIKTLALDTLANVSKHIKLVALPHQELKFLFQTLNYCIHSHDRLIMVRGLEILGNLCSINNNLNILSSQFPTSSFDRLLTLLTISDILIICRTLETLYQMSLMGEHMANSIASVPGSIETLVNFLTLDSSNLMPRPQKKTLPPTQPGSNQPTPGFTPHISSTKHNDSTAYGHTPQTGGNNVSAISDAIINLKFGLESPKNLPQFHPTSSFVRQNFTHTANEGIDVEHHAYDLPRDIIIPRDSKDPRTTGSSISQSDRDRAQSSTVVCDAYSTQSNGYDTLSDERRNPTRATTLMGHLHLSKLASQRALALHTEASKFAETWFIAYYEECEDCLIPRAEMLSCYNIYGKRPRENFHPLKYTSLCNCIKRAFPNSRLSRKIRDDSKQLQVLVHGVKRRSIPLPLEEASIIHTARSTEKKAKHNQRKYNCSNSTPSAKTLLVTDKTPFPKPLVEVVEELSSTFPSDILITNTTIHTPSLLPVSVRSNDSKSFKNYRGVLPDLYYKGALKKAMTRLMSRPKRLKIITTKHSVRATCGLKNNFDPTSKIHQDGSHQSFKTSTTLDSPLLQARLLMSGRSGNNTVPPATQTHFTTPGMDASLPQEPQCKELDAEMHTDCKIISIPPSNLTQMTSDNEKDPVQFFNRTSTPESTPTHTPGSFVNIPKPLPVTKGDSPIPNHVTAKLTNFLGVEEEALNGGGTDLVDQLDLSANASKEQVTVDNALVDNCEPEPMEIDEIQVCGDGDKVSPSNTPISNGPYDPSLPTLRTDNVEYVSQTRSNCTDPSNVPLGRTPKPHPAPVLNGAYGRNYLLCREKLTTVDLGTLGDGENVVGNAQTFKMTPRSPPDTPDDVDVTSPRPDHTKSGNMNNGPLSPALPTSPTHRTNDKNLKFANKLLSDLIDKGSLFLEASRELVSRGEGVKIAATQTSQSPFTLESQATTTIVDKDEMEIDVPSDCPKVECDSPKVEVGQSSDDPMGSALEDRPHKENNPTAFHLVQLFKCGWINCDRTFETVKAVLSHAYFHHAQQPGGCFWYPCIGRVHRQKFSLATHLQEVHCIPKNLQIVQDYVPITTTPQSLPVTGLSLQPIPNSTNANKSSLAAPALPTNSSPNPPSRQSTKFDPPDQTALQAIQRHFNSMATPLLLPIAEDSVTKSIRLISALILRNLSKYSPLIGKRKIKAYESYLTLNTMNQTEASSALSQTLWELNH